MKAYKHNKFNKELVFLGEVNNKLEWYELLLSVSEAKENPIVVKRQVMTVDNNNLYVDTGDLTWSFMVENCTVHFLNSLGDPGWWLKEK